MITNRLIDTRLEFLTGSIVESDDILKDNAVTVVAKDATVHLRKTGIYRFDAEPAGVARLKGSRGCRGRRQNLPESGKKANC